MRPAPCDSCGRDAVLLAMESIVTGEDIFICVSCADQHAEPYPLICKAVRAGIWQALPRVIRRQIRLWHCERYVTTSAYARARRRTQVALCPPKATKAELEADEEAVRAKYIAEKAAQTRAVPEQMPTPTRRPFWNSIMDWFRLVPIWSTP